MSKIIHTSISNDRVYERLFNEAQLGAYTSFIRGRRCETEEDFFKEISASFQFPWYFGENWSAFDECICDLEWIKFNRIFLVINDYKKIFKGNVKLHAYSSQTACGFC